MLGPMHYSQQVVEQQDLRLVPPLTGVLEDLTLVGSATYSLMRWTDPPATKMLRLTALHAFPISWRLKLPRYVRQEASRLVQVMQVRHYRLLSLDRGPLPLHVFNQRVATSSQHSTKENLTKPAGQCRQLVQKSN